MVNILVECPSLVASVRVGVLQPLQPLEESGQCALRYRNTADITKQDICWCDILIVVRGRECATLKTAEAAKSAGKFLIYLLDDDLLNVPEGLSTSGYYRDPKIRQNIPKIISLCQVLWAVNGRILEKYGVYCPRQVLSRVPVTILKDASPCQGEKLRFLYAGSMDNSALAQQKLAPAVRRVLQRYPDKADFTFVGADPKLGNLDGVKCYPYFDSYEAYQKVLLEGNFDLGLAPGNRNPFFSCKYYNKFTEYSTFGIGGIYEDCPPFTDIVRDGENGILCGETADDWYEALCGVIEGKWDIPRIARNAQEQIRRDFSPAAIARKLSEDIPELVSFHSPERKPEEIRLPSMKRFFWGERLKQYWRRYGIRMFFAVPRKATEKIWRALRQKTSAQ